MERKMAFYEIGKYGENENAVFPFVDEVQKSFEKLQKITKERYEKTTLEIKINIHPSENLDEFGSVSFSINEKIPPRKSRLFTTKINEEGLIVATGSSAIDIDQLKLFPEKKIIKLNKGE